MGRLNLNKKSKGNLGQCIAEYFLVMMAILAVILSIGVIDSMRSSFDGYFNHASGRLAGSFSVMHLFP